MTAALISVGITFLGALLTALGYFTKIWIASLQEDLHILGGALNGITDTLQKQNERLTTFHVRLVGVEADLRALRHEFESHRVVMENRHQSVSDKVDRQQNERE